MASNLTLDPNPSTPPRRSFNLITLSLGQRIAGGIAILRKLSWLGVGGVASLFANLVSARVRVRVCVGRCLVPNLRLFHLRFFEGGLHTHATRTPKIGGGGDFLVGERSNVPAQKKALP